MLSVYERYEATHKSFLHDDASSVRLFSGQDGSADHGGFARRVGAGMGERSVPFGIQTDGECLLHPVVSEVSGVRVRAHQDQRFPCFKNDEENDPS